MKIPANIYETFCPKCGGRVEYSLFQSSFYGFETYLELNSKTIIRIDLEGVHHSRSTADELLKGYAETNLKNQNEVEWINQSKERFCEQCKTRFHSSEGINSRLCVEEKIEAETLPKKETQQ